MKQLGLLISTLLLISGLMATEPVPIRQIWDLNFTGQHARTADGCVIVLWEDTVFGSKDILAQKLNSSGSALWTEPRPVVVKPGIQKNAKIVTTSDNNFIVVWQEETSYDQHNIYAQKITSNGQRLWQEEGIALFLNSAYLVDYVPVADQNGGTYIVHISSYSPASVRGHHLDSYGNNLWQENGVDLFVHNSSVLLDTALPDGTGGMVINIRKYVSPAGYHNHLVRINTSGNAVGNNPMLPEGIFPEDYYRLHQGLNGQFVLYSVYGQFPANFMFQKMDAQGNLLLPALVQYTTSHTLSYNPYEDLKLANTPDGGLVFGWGDYENVSQPQLRLQKLSPDFVPMWQEGGVVPTTGPWRHGKMSIAVGSNGGVWLSWVDSAVESEPENYIHMVKGQYLTPEGQPVWTTGGVNVSSYGSYIGNTVSIAFAERGMFLWKSNVTNENAIARQVFNTGGTPLMDLNGVPLASHLAGYALVQENIALGENYMFLWQDQRYFGKWKIYYQIASVQLATQLEPNGQVLNANSNSEETVLGIAKNSLNQVGILYRSWNGTVPRSYFQIVDSSGNCLLPEMGISIPGAPQNPTDTSVSSEGEDFYLAWMYYTNDRTSGVKGQRISNGQPMWGENGISIVSFGPYTPVSLYAPVVQGRYFLWQEFDNGLYVLNLRARRVNMNGSVCNGWESNVSIGNGSYSQLISSGLCGGKLVTFIEDDASAVRIQIVNSEGIMLWPEGGYAISSAYPPVWLQDVLYQPESFTYLYSNQGEQTQSRLRKMNADGEELFGQDGQPIPLPHSLVSEAKLAAYANGWYSLYWAQNNQPVDFATDILHRFINTDGEPAGEVQTICNAIDDQYNIALATSGNYSSAIWQDSRLQIWYGDEQLTSIYGRWIRCEGSGVDEVYNVPGSVILTSTNYPNPFNPSTKISFSLADKSPVSLDIYNLKGQMVRRLASGILLEQGQHSYRWDGCDDKGKTVSSGVYLYRLSAGSQTETAKMLLMK